MVHRTREHGVDEGGRLLRREAAERLETVDGVRTHSRINLHRSRLSLTQLGRARMRALPDVVGEDGPASLVPLVRWRGAGQR